jgi:hypothetical protein
VASVGMAEPQVAASHKSRARPIGPIPSCTTLAIGGAHGERGKATWRPDQGDESPFNTSWA